MNNKRYDAFISYRRENGFLMAQVIYDRLKDRGIQCFLDLEELRSGKFDEKILVAIREAHTFILILPPNSLDRCKNEDDWVRQEIMEAVRCNKVIIPVMYDGFKWPRKWDAEFPEEFHGLENMNGVSGSQEYLPAMIDKIISYMPQEVAQNSALADTSMRNEISTKTSEFFKETLKNTAEIQSVDMAFHAGANWRHTSEKVEFLTYLIENKIPLRVLANTGAVVDNVTKSMTQPLRKYVGYDQNLQEWRELSLQFPEYIFVRTPSVPMLHRLYIIRGKDGGAVNVKYYTYGNYKPEKDVRIAYKSGTREYKLYLEEFDYLWEHSEEYTPELMNE